MLDNHKFGDPSRVTAPKLMDLHNNRVGQSIAISMSRMYRGSYGGRVINVVAEQREVVRRCQWALVLNQLRYLHP